MTKRNRFLILTTALWLGALYALTAMMMLDAKPLQLVDAVVEAAQTVAKTSAAPAEAAVSGSAVRMDAPAAQPLAVREPRVSGAIVERASASAKRNRAERNVVDPRMKVQDVLLDGALPEGVEDGLGGVRVCVTFHKDATRDEAVAAFEHAGGDVTDGESFQYARFMNGTVPAGSVVRLAEAEAVEYVVLQSSQQAEASWQEAGWHGGDQLAAPSHGLNRGHGVNIAVFDVGTYANHHAFHHTEGWYENKKAHVAWLDSSYPTQSEHTTHVVGTMVAHPAMPSPVRGSCWDAAVGVFHFANAVNKSYTARNVYNADLYNHSWSRKIGWELENGQWHNYGGTWQFGAYTADARALDAFVRDSDDMGVLAGVFIAAGNHKGDNSPAGNDGAYDNLTPDACAKNVITVGSGFVGNPHYIAPYSSRGPTDDMRIKPDVCVKGLIHSTGGWTNAGYPVTNNWVIKDGTSHATALATAMTASLLECFRNKIGRDPFACELKALLITTTDDLGPVGPDIHSGWGALNMERAYQLIKRQSEDGAPEDGIWENDFVEEGESRFYGLNVSPGTTHLRVGLVWTDAAGAPQGTPGYTKALVNDLDVTLIDPNGGLHYPCRLVNGLLAVDAPNRVDNVEQVIVLNPMPGAWGVEIRGHEFGDDAPQRYTVIAAHAAAQLRVDPLPAALLVLPGQNVVPGEGVVGESDPIQVGQQHFVQLMLVDEEFHQDARFSGGYMITHETMTGDEPSAPNWLSNSYVNGYDIVTMQQYAAAPRNRYTARVTVHTAFGTYVLRAVSGEYESHEPAPPVLNKPDAFRGEADADSGSRDRLNPESNPDGGNGSEGPTVGGGGVTITADGVDEVGLAPETGDKNDTPSAGLPAEDDEAAPMTPDTVNADDTDTAQDRTEGEDSTESVEAVRTKAPDVTTTTAPVVKK